MVVPQAAILLRPSYEFRPKDPRFAFDLGWRLAGWLSRSLSRRLRCPGLVLPGPRRNAMGNLAPTKFAGARIKRAPETKSIGVIQGL